MSMTIGGTSGLVFPDSSTQNTAATGFGFKNRIINGAMMIDQRNAGASVTVGTGTYLIDRWKAENTQSSKFTAQQSTTVPAGYTNSLLITSSSAYSVLTSDLFSLVQYVEGLNVGDLSWGTASAQSVTLSFWVRSSLTGTFGGSIQNSAANRSYPFSYTISAANTWEQKTVTIAGDTTGTWLTTNGIGIAVRFGLGSGSTYSGTAGAWTAGNIIQPTGSVSVVGTNGATFYITGVQLEKGSTATSFDYRPYGTELQLCQRYYWKNVSGSLYAAFGSGVMTSATNAQIYTAYPVTMRTLPTTSFSTLSCNWGTSSGSVSGISSNFAGTGSSLLNFTVSGATTGNGAVIQANNNANGYLDFSAEL